MCHNTKIEMKLLLKPRSPHYNHGAREGEAPLRFPLQQKALNDGQQQQHPILEKLVAC